MGNKSWVFEVEAKLGDLFERTYIHVYKHWTDNKPLINLDFELSKLGEVLKEFEDYTIFAKSAGTLLTLRGVHEGVLAPDKCIFVGLPVPWGVQNKFDCNTWLQNYSISTLFIQKSLDPASSFEDVKALLLDKEVANCDLRELPGDTHDYEDLNLLRELVEQFMQSHKSN